MELILPIGACIIGTICCLMASICLGIIIGERQSRIEIRDQMNDERHVLKDALKQMSETHNALVTTQAGIDIRLGDVEQRVNIMLQGVKK